MNEEFEKWWHGDDTLGRPTDIYTHDSAKFWAYQGWVRGAAAERKACAAICDEGCSFDGDIIRARDNT